MTKAAKRPTTTTTTVLEPLLEASRLVSKIWDGSFTPEDRERLTTALDCPWCPTCYGYLPASHVCWAELSASLRAEALAARITADHEDALVAESMGALAAGLRWFPKVVAVGYVTLEQVLDPSLKDEDVTWEWRADA